MALYDNWNIIIPYTWRICGNMLHFDFLKDRRFKVLPDNINTIIFEHENGFL